MLLLQQASLTVQYKFCQYPFTLSSGSADNIVLEPFDAPIHWRQPWIDNVSIHKFPDAACGDVPHIVTSTAFGRQASC